MRTIHAIFTKRAWNPVSWLIRWTVPRSRFALSLSSHCMIVDGDYIFEANMLHGVRRAPKAVALKNLTVVQTVDYTVPDAEKGLAFLRAQVCTYQAPIPKWMPVYMRSTYQSVMLFIHSNYDWAGAFGVAIDPSRDWMDPGWWFCYELLAAAIRESGRDIFRHTGYITESTLLSIKP